MMVATILALGGFGKTGSVPGIADYFTSDCNSSYYLEGGQQPGQWYGDGSKALGLRGAVGRTEFENLLAGRSPDGHRVLSQSKEKRRRFYEPQGGDSSSEKEVVAESGAGRTRRLHNPGYDLTFSVPKSVSIWWALADRETQKQIDMLIDRAARQTLAYVQDELMLGRRGIGGLHQERAGLVVGMFHHYDNRNGDPQRHVHCTVLTPCLRSDGSWASINGAKLRDWTRTLGPMFRCQLATELRELFGVSLTNEARVGGKCAAPFELKDIPHELVKHWSSRREEIRQELARNGIDFSNATASERTRANIQSRGSKKQSRPLQERIEDWRKEAMSLGMELPDVSCRGLQAETRMGQKLFDRLVLEAAERLHQNESSFTFRELLKEVCEACETSGIRGRDSARRLERTLEDSAEIRSLGPRGREPAFCTQRMWDLEKKLIDSVDRMIKRPGAQVTDRKLGGVLKNHQDLSIEQIEAVRVMTQGEGSLRGLTGVAGAGKTKTLDVTREAFEKAGYTVIGGALSGAAKEELASQAHVKSRTVASYLYQLDKSAMEKLADRIKHDAKQILRAAVGKQTSRPASNPLNGKTVLILDEVGMLDTKLLGRLLHHAERAKATVILAGDSKQLQPIGPGGPFHYIEPRIQSGQLLTNRRQRHEQDRKAVGLVRQGEAKEALENYAERGRLRISKNRTQAEQALVKQWVESGGVKKPEDNFIFTQTRQEARRMCGQCQEARQQNGAVDRSGGVRIGEEQFFKGDRVMFHKPDRTQGIENGYRGTIVNIKGDTLAIKLDRRPSPEQVARGHKQLISINIKDVPEGGLTLGYAATTHKMQGNTVENSFILLGGKMTSRELTYVQATRAREATFLFTDRLSAGDDLQELARPMSRSRAKQMAHEIHRENDRNARPELRPSLEL